MHFYGMQHFLRLPHTNQKDLAVFFSIEMPVAAVTERFGQSILQMSGNALESRWQQGFTTEQDIADHKAGMDHIIIIPTRPNIRQMERLIAMVERKHKRRVGLIGIDYLGLVAAPGPKEYDRVSFVATEVKVMAKYLQKPVVMLCQLNRGGKDGKERVTLDMARGSGQVEEACDFMFGLWQHDDDLILTTLKNRKGPKDRDFILDLNKSHMAFYGAERWEHPANKQRKEFE